MRNGPHSSYKWYVKWSYASRSYNSECLIFHLGCIWFAKLDQMNLGLHANTCINGNGATIQFSCMASNGLGEKKIRLN
jgi:hypothetical protein